MQKELNDRLLRSLKTPDTGRLEISDTKRKGLRFRLSNTGSAVFMYEKRIKGGPKRKYTLGSWPGYTLSQARADALTLEVEAAQGIDRIKISEEKNITDQNKQKSDEKAAANRLSVLDIIADSFKEAGYKIGDKKTNIMFLIKFITFLIIFYQRCVLLFFYEYEVADCQYI